MDLRECVEHITNGVVSRTERCRGTRDRYLLEEEIGQGPEADQSSVFGIVEAIRGSGYLPPSSDARLRADAGTQEQHSFCISGSQFFTSIGKVDWGTKAEEHELSCRRLGSKKKRNRSHRRGDPVYLYT